MKILHYFLLPLVVVVGCKPSPPPPVAAEDTAASFKEGHGVKLPAMMQKSLGVEILDVTEQKLIPRFEIPLHVIRGAQGAGTEVNGWVTAAQAEAIQPGQQSVLTLPDGRNEPAKVVRIEKSIDPVAGDLELTLTTAATVEPGTTVTARFEAPSTDEVVAIPHSAVMNTAAGEFVYVVNEEHFKRVAVETGARGANSVEIKDGLYAGDQIVSAQVIPIWMTELQTLRAGQSCCKGH